MNETSLINFWENTPFIMKKLTTPGLLLVSGDGINKKNIMTIGWLELGFVWREPVITIAVRPSRYTYKLLNEHSEFTINILPEENNKEIEYCGAQSGAFCDKFSETNLTPAASKIIKTPAIKEALLSIECKIIHKNKIDDKTLSDLIVARYYSKGDFHELFTGKIEHYTINKKKDIKNE